MYAVLETGSKQYRVSAGDTLQIERLAIAAGEPVTFERVLLVNNEGGLAIGSPTVANAVVVADVMEHWYARRPVIFENRDLDLAVAVGAAYYSYVRATGAGLLVRGGLPRSYFIGLGGGEENELRTLCLVPRGTEDGSTIEIDPGNLQSGQSVTIDTQ